LARFQPKNPVKVEDILEGIVPVEQRGEEHYGAEVARIIIIKAFREGCDITTACGLAKVTKQRYLKWMKNDSKFALDAIHARETAVRELLIKCKAEPSQAWKILKNIAKGRYQDEPGVKDSGTHVQVLFNIPRPQHILAKGESVKLIEGEKSE
jgi:hypothetical protein